MISILLVTLPFFGNFLVSEVSGHGRLIEPPSRASMWRFGFGTPENYNDHELYCGGYSRQWNRNGGKCGICGDPWDMKKVLAIDLNDTSSVFSLRQNQGP